MKRVSSGHGVGLETAGGMEVCLGGQGLPWALRGSASKADAVCHGPHHCLVSWKPYLSLHVLGTCSAPEAVLVQTEWWNFNPLLLLLWPRMLVLFNSNLSCSRKPQNPTSISLGALAKGVRPHMLLLSHCVPSDNTLVLNFSKRPTQFGVLFCSFNAGKRHDSPTQQARFSFGPPSLASSQYTCWPRFLHPASTCWELPVYVTIC